MDERLSAVAGSRADLIRKLDLFLDGAPAGVDFFHGRVDRERESVPAVPDPGAGQTDSARLAETWARGAHVDWNRFHGEARPRRMAAPTYPFSRERYWIGPGDSQPAASAPAPAKPAARAMRTELMGLREGPVVFESPAARPVFGLRSLSPRSFSASPPSTSQPAMSPAASLATDGRISERRLIASLRSSLAKALFLDESAVDPEKPFVDLGLDSIVGVEWVHAINKEFGLTMPATRIYDHPTVRRLAAYLYQNLAGARDADKPDDQPDREGAPNGQAAQSPSPEPLRLESSLSLSLSQALYIEAKTVERAKPFVELGLDSIVGVEWVHAINREFGVNLPATRIYEYPTIQRLAQHLGSLLSERQAPRQPIEKPAPARGFHSAGPHREPIAVIGMSGRYPEAQDLDQYWKNLAEGRNSVREIPRDRWNAGEYFDPDTSAPGGIYCKWLGALDDIDRFDPLFFGIRLPKPRPWIHSTGCSSKKVTRRLKMPGTVRVFSAGSIAASTWAS